MQAILLFIPQFPPKGHFIALQKLPKKRIKILRKM